MNVKSIKSFKLQAKQLLKDNKLCLSKKECQGVKNQLDSCAIPAPKLLIKDHKPIKPNSQFPCRLVVPAESFISGFLKLGYLNMHNLFTRNSINVARFIIV